MGTQLKLQDSNFKLWILEVYQRSKTCYVVVLCVSRWVSCLSYLCQQTSVSGVIFEVLLTLEVVFCYRQKSGTFLTYLQSVSNVLNAVFKSVFNSARMGEEN